MSLKNLESKISLINKYIQLNIIKSHGEILHNAVPENDLFASIIDDMKAFNVLPDEPKISLKPVIDGLKALQEMELNMRKKLDSTMEAFRTIRDEQSNPQISLESIITDLESFNEIQKKR